MNRFNLFFVFLFTLISSALHYSIQEEEKIKNEIKSLFYFHHEPKDKQNKIVEAEEKKDTDQKTIIPISKKDCI